MNLIFLVIKTWDIISVLRYIHLSREQELYFIIYITDQNNKDSTHQEKKYWRSSLLTTYILISSH